MTKYVLLILLVSTVACRPTDTNPVPSSSPKATVRFTQCPLNGADVAHILDIIAAKWQFQGKPSSYSWCISTDLLSPDGPKHSRRILASGEIHLGTNSELLLMIPAFTGGDAKISVGAMRTTIKSCETLPKHEGIRSWVYNDTVSGELNERILVGVFANDEVLTVPAKPTFKPAKGSALMVYIELREKLSTFSDYDSN